MTKQKKCIIVLLMVIILLVLGKNLFYKDDSIKIINNIDKIQEHYNDYVIVNNTTNLYDENNIKIGKLGKGAEILLEKQDINDKTTHFKTKINDNYYYTSYKDVSPIEEISSIDEGYKNYIVFNENIVTNDKTSFYDENNNLVYQFNESFDLPIIIKEDDKYGIQFNNRLLYVKKADVKEVKESYNTDKTNASGIGVLNYHAFYDENNAEERANCNTSICHSKKQFISHLEYFKENNILTLKMKELEMYIDGKIQLPKSALITFDDGGREQIGIDLLTEYKMYGTIFLVTSWFEPSEYYTTEYIELHSHSHHMHEIGDCPTGQGGGIQCLSEEEIQNDLRISREKLNNTTYFCYPFYEYNSYSIEMLKKAGFTMAFIGESNSSDNLVHVGSDKFRLRRFVVVNYTTLNDFDEYFGQIN